MKQVCARGMNDVLQGKAEKNYGLLSSLGNTWLAAHKLSWEIETMSDLEKRLIAVEEEAQKNKEVRHGYKERVRETSY